MSIGGLTPGPLGPSDAGEAALRVQRLEELVNTAAAAGTPAGEASFAAALQAASAEGGAPPEAPEPTEAAGTGAESEGAGAEMSALDAISAGAGSDQPQSAAATLPGAASPGYGAGGVYATPTYADPPPYAAPPYAGALGGGAGGGYPGGGAIGGYPSSSSAYAAGGYAAPTAGASPNSLGGASEVAGASPYAGLIAREATRNGVETALLQGLIQQESGFDPTAESVDGAAGLTQLMPSTAASLGVSDPFQPQQAIAGGARLLGELLRQFDGNVGYALAAYNAGAGAVERYGGIPPYPETEAYVQKVLANAERYRSAA
jgi:Transglycosylase SLT domain